MAKGRSRKSGAREKSGRPSRAGINRDVRTVATLQPHRAWLAKGARMSQDAESVLGCAFLAGLISEPQKWAGEKYRKLSNEFSIVLVTPITRASASSIGVSISMETPAEADYLAAETAETFEEKTERVSEAVKAMGYWLTREQRRELDAVIIGNQPIGDLEALRGGLAELVALWRLEAQAAGSGKIRGVVIERAAWAHIEREIAISYSSG